MDRLEKMLTTHLKVKPGPKPDFTHPKRLLLQRAAVENQRRARQRALFWWLAVGSLAASITAALILTGYRILSQANLSEPPFGTSSRG